MKWKRKLFEVEVIFICLYTDVIYSFRSLVDEVNIPLHCQQVV